MKKKIFSVLIALVLLLSMSLVTALPVSASTVDLAVNDENPWSDGAFAFENISPGGNPMAFNFKLHNVGDSPGVLTFSMSVSENDMAGAPAPNMSADEFASLIYVEAVSYQYIWLTDPDGPYEGSVRDDLSSWLAIDGYFNNDGKVSLYELCGASPIPYGDYEGDQLEAGAEITYFIEFQLGNSLEGGVAGGAILTGVEDNSLQGDGVSVTITATLGTDTEVSSDNVFQAAPAIVDVETDVVAPFAGFHPRTEWLGKVRLVMRSGLYCTTEVYDLGYAPDTDFYYYPTVKDVLPAIEQELGRGDERYKIVIPEGTVISPVVKVLKVTIADGAVTLSSDVDFSQEVLVYQLVDGEWVVIAVFGD